MWMTVVALVALVAWAGWRGPLVGWVDGWTIDSPTTVIGAAGAAVVGAGLAVGLGRRPRRWWISTFPLLAVGVAGLVAAVAWYLRASATIVDGYPRSFLLWVGLALLTAAMVVTGWRRSGTAGRAAGAAAIALAFAAAFLLINSHYGYWPTLGDLLGHPVPGQVSAATLNLELAHPLITDVRRAPLNPVLEGRELATSSELSQARARANRPVVPTLARLAADDAVGQFAAVQIPATVSHFVHRWNYVYLPPAYFTAARAQLGVVILLAGTPSSPDIWATGGHAVATANAYAASHHGVAPVLLFVDANGSWNGDTECVNGPQGQAETYLTTDVVGFAVRTLHLTADPAKWGIVGFSEGGTCALDLTLRHPGLFHHFVDLAGDAAPNYGTSTLHRIFGGSRVAMYHHQLPWLLKHPVGNNRVLSGWFGAGIDDARHVHLSVLQARATRRAGLLATQFVGPDGHNWQFCTWALRWVLPRLAAEVGPNPSHRSTPRHGSVFSARVLQSG